MCLDCVVRLDFGLMATSLSGLELSFRFCFMLFALYFRIVAISVFVDSIVVTLDFICLYCWLLDFAGWVL